MRGKNVCLKGIKILFQSQIWKLKIKRTLLIIAHKFFIIHLEGPLLENKKLPQ